MASSYIVEPKESPKKDDTLIIVLTDDGTLSVDQATLQNLIMNQTNANVSVVRMGQAEGDPENGDLTFTVDPPAFVASESTPLNTAGTPDTTLVDPFMEMDPEQLEKLETALQSEQAKQILGENVAAMLDMLTVEEAQNTIKYAIELDHCYTSRSSPADPAPLDPLPVANSPEEGASLVVSTQLQPTPPPVVEEAPAKPPVKPKQPPGRPRKSAVPNVQSTGPAAKSPAPGPPRSQQKAKDDEANTDGFSSSTESSDSTTSDNDSDFGPRGPRRPGVRARGGRRGITTRGGSMAGRRRGSGKRMDVEQARRLDIEMAAAVTAMKAEPCEKEKIQTPTKKQLKIIPSRKKEEPLPVAPSLEESPVDNSLQTTNQVKANLINANMIKGDMILTKPGQGRTNQRMVFVQKKMVMKTNDMRTLVKTSPNILSKDPSRTMNQIQTKIVTSEDGKLVTSSSKLQEPTPQPMEIDDASSLPSQSAQLSKPSKIVVKTIPKAAILSPRIKDDPAVTKVKQSPDMKRDTKKPDVTEPLKIEELPKTPEIKTPESLKKHVKKDQRKSPGNADALGPALFSTPDIIRRVSSGGDLKTLEMSSSTGLVSESDMTAPEAVPTLITSSVGAIVKEDVNLEPELPPESSNPPTDTLPEIKYSNDQDSSLLVDKTKQEDTRLTDPDDLQSSLDPASSSTANGEIARPSEDSVHNIISNQPGIEGEEHLLATLEMEATKHEEELLAEALLLQEHLDVDIPDTAALDGSTSAISDSLLSPTTFDTSMLTVPSVEPSPEKRVEIPIQSTPLRSDQTKKKEPSKEPIQIVRGGRVITLPPIEAPATRSKRLQLKSESKPQDVPKKEEKPKEVHREIKPEEMDSEMDDEEDEDNSDSEDDPDRLWCICKRPHNNRFMICCDVCEDWFHGKCVHVSKAMGQQMEEQGIEWVCPNCAKKKIETPPNTKIKPAKSTKVEASSQKLNESVSQPVATEKPMKQEVKQVIAMPVVGTTQCVVCKKEARNSSIYCSDACILMHAQETLTKDKPPTPTMQPKVAKASTGDAVVKPSPDARVIVFEPLTGKFLTGMEAPTTSNLKTWLKEHPTFELVRPNNLNTLQIGGKTVAAIQTQGQGKILKTQSGQPKMVFTKIVGSKQTVLAASKKPVVVSNIQNVNILSKTGQKQFVIASNKSPSGQLKQTTLKLVAQAPGKGPVVAIKQAPVKKETQIKASTSTTKQPQKSPAPRKPEPEPIRTNVRKTLAECLTNRLKETEDLTLTDEEIGDLALNIEVELYKYFRDTGPKYRAKYRSLQFNIKDSKNLTLFRKIADKSLTPYAVVRLSPEEMASQELAEWREKETKHQLEMIKKNELELMAQAKSIVVKTHKGEQIIENVGVPTEVVDPKTSVQDIVTVLNNAENTSSDIMEDKEDTSQEELRKSSRDNKKKKKDRERDRDRDNRKSRNRDRGSKDSKRDRSKSKHHHSRDRSKDRSRRRSKDGKRDKNRDREHDRDRSSKDKYKDKEKEKDKSNGSRKSSSMRSKSSPREHRDLEKKRIIAEDEVKRDSEKKKDASPVQTEKPIEDRLWRHIEDDTTTNTLDGNESDVSDREPSSTVNITTPDINEEAEKEKEPTTEVETTAPVTSAIEPAKPASQTVWRGFVSMPDVAKFFITAHEVSGHAKDLMEGLPDTVDVVGRISHQTVWEYLSRTKKAALKEILVIQLTAANDEERIPYITLYSYLNSRGRLGVVGNVSSNIKDFYIMPFSSTSKIPPILSSLMNLNFDDQQPHLLLGILVRNQRKRMSHPLPMPAIAAKVSRKNSDRSYTPPPSAIYSSKDKLSSTTDKSGLDIYSESAAVTQKTLSSLNKAQVGMSRSLLDSATISKIVPELSSKLDLTFSPKAAQDDDDAPYSPGDIDDDVDDSMTSLTPNTCLLSSTKDSDLQRKMDELNRQIEEQKQQIQSISSSFLGESVPTLPGLGLDPPGTNDDEAYSPTDAGSFTPPPQNLAFAQPILDKVSNITIPANLQEILANVKRQENSKVDPYLPSKPTASFLTGSIYQKAPEPTYTPTVTTKDSKSTLRSLSDMDLIKKAEAELAAVAASAALVPVRSADVQRDSMDIRYPTSVEDTADYSMARVMEQPKPPGVENDELPLFPSGPGPIGVSRVSSKFVPKSGVVLNISRKVSEDGELLSSQVKPRAKSRWGQAPGDS